MPEEKGPQVRAREGGDEQPGTVAAAETFLTARRACAFCQVHGVC